MKSKQKKIYKKKQTQENRKNKQKKNIKWNTTKPEQNRKVLNRYITRIGQMETIEQNKNRQYDKIEWESR